MKTIEEKREFCKSHLTSMAATERAHADMFRAAALSRDSYASYLDARIAAVDTADEEFIDLVISQWRFHALARGAENAWHRADLATFELARSYFLSELPESDV